MRKSLTIGLVSTLLTLLGPRWAFAGDIVIGSFQGLNTQDNAVALEDGEAQDLLNIGITPGGKSVYKREGYGLHKTLSYSTSAVHGLHYFQDLSGSDIQLYGHDAYLAASVNGASPVDIATGTVNATWQCTDNSGFAYCVTSQRNTPVRTSGTTGTSTYMAGIPLGTMITNTPDRLVVAGVSGAESSLYFSQANTFSNFTIGINSADPYVEVINSPGSRITHIRYACGKLLWWKDGSFGYSVGSDQYNIENITVSQSIGTLDNSSDEYNGMVYFRGQDNHIYQYDCSNVTRLSRKITPTVQASGRRKSNSWTQTNQSDWQSGVFQPSGNFSTTLSVGDITVSSVSVSETSSADFAQGTLSNTTSYTGISIRISTNNAGNIGNNGFEACSGITPSSFTLTTASGLGWRCFSSMSFNAKGCGTGSLLPRSGSYLGFDNVDSGSAFTLKLVDLAGSTLETKSISVTGAQCSWTSSTITVSPTNIGKRFRLKVENPNGNILTSDPSYVLGGNIVFYYANETTGGFFGIDDITAGSSTITLGTYASRAYDSGASAVYAYTTANWTVSVSTPYIELQTSSDGSTWTKATSSTGTTSLANRYIRYISSFSVGTDANALSTLDDVSVVAKSTGGIYLSPVDNASSLSSWSTFGANDQSAGGSLTYYVRASTGSFTVLSSTPLWAAQSKNATVNYATGTYMQVMASFTVTNATAPMSLSDFTFNWFEGNSVDKAYIKYWNDYVWIAVSSGTTGVNNRIQRWDILNQTWLLDDIAANGFLVDNNSLYFGSPSAGKVYKYGNGLTTDDSGDINAYWKSKNFSGDDPFVQKNWDQSDFVVKAASPTIMSVIYQLDGSTTTTYSMNLYHPSKTILHKGVNLSGRVGTFYNVRFGDSSSNPRWEVFGYRSKYTPLPWRPE